MQSDEDGSFGALISSPSALLDFAVRSLDATPGDAAAAVGRLGAALASEMPVKGYVLESPRRQADTGQDRRRARRRAIELPVVLELADGTELRRGSTIDLSERGARLQVPRTASIAQSQAGVLVLQEPDASVLPLDVVVVRSEEASEQLGVSFVSDTPRSKERLAQLLVGPTGGR